MVEGGEPRIERHGVGGEQRSEVGRFAADDPLHEDFERSAKIGREHRRKLGEQRRILRDVRRVVDPQPLPEEVGQFPLGSRVGRHPLRVPQHAGRIGQLALGSGGEQRWIGQRVPQDPRQAARDVVRVGWTVRDFHQQEPRGLQRPQHHAFDRGFHIGGFGELLIDKRRGLFLGERSAEGEFDEAATELFHPFLALRVVRLDVRQFRQTCRDVGGCFQGGVRGGLVPGLGNRRATLVTNAAIVRRKSGRHDERFRHGRGPQIAVGQRFVDGPLRLSPPQRDRRGLFLEFEVVQPQRVGAATEQLNRLAEFDARARSHPGVDQSGLRIVHEQPGAVLGLQDEFVFASLRRDDRAVPANRELGRLDLGRIGARVAKLKEHRRIDAFQYAVVAAGLPLLVVFRTQSRRGWPRGLRPESSEEIGERLLILPHRQTRQLDTRRLTAGLRGRRIKRVVNVSGGSPRVLSDTQFGRVFRHRVVNQFREFVNRLIPNQHVRVVLRMPFAFHPMATCALIRVDHASPSQQRWPA